MIGSAWKPPKKPKDQPDRLLTLVVSWGIVLVIVMGLIYITLLVE